MLSLYRARVNAPPAACACGIETVGFDRDRYDHADQLPAELLLPRDPPTHGQPHR